MQVCKYERMHEYASMQLCKDASPEEWKNEIIIVKIMCSVRQVPKWKTTLPQRFMTCCPWKTTNMEDDQHGIRPKWKTTKMEDDQNGRGPKWKTTKIEDYQNGRINILSQPNQPELNIFSKPNQLKLNILLQPNQPQLDILSQSNQPQINILS